MPIVHAVRILVIDDDVDAAELLEELLQARGYEAECEARMEQFHERLKDTAYDVIISDIRLGTWSGLELPALFGALGGARPLMIALSGDYGVKAEERSLAAGFDFHFSKPVELDQLETRIRALRSLQRVEEGPASSRIPTIKEQSHVDADADVA